MEKEDTPTWRSSESTVGLALPLSVVAQGHHCPVFEQLFQEEHPQVRSCAQWRRGACILTAQPGVQISFTLLSMGKQS